MVEQDFEGVVTLGMRGNGDTGLPDGDGIDLMREIIATQRKILADVTGKDVTTIPQVWTLYKEVQRYWDRGLRAPEDVTVVLTDDNWGNIRKHPDPAEPARPGGYGLYYHFDYVGVGRNYKWVDTTSLPNMWDQLRQAVAYGNHGLWVTNTGDLKGNELPTQFFLDYAWNPDRWDLDALPEWERRYARQNFGEAQAGEIASILAEYARLQSLRKPELLNRRITLDPDKDPTEDESAIVYDDRATPSRSPSTASSNASPPGGGGSPSGRRRPPGGCPGPTRTPSSNSSATRSWPPPTSTRCARPSSPTCSTPRRAGPPPTIWRAVRRPG